MTTEWREDPSPSLSRSHTAQKSYGTVTKQTRNSAITNRSRVSCAGHRKRPSKVTQSHQKCHGSEGPYLVSLQTYSHILVENCEIYMPHLYATPLQSGWPIGILQRCLALKQEVKVIWQKAPHGEPIPRLGVTPGGRNLYHWIPGVGIPISVP